MFIQRQYEESLTRKNIIEGNLGQNSDPRESLVAIWSPECNRFAHESSNITHSPAYSRSRRFRLPEPAEFLLRPLRTPAAIFAARHRNLRDRRANDQSQSSVRLNEPIGGAADLRFASQQVHVTKGRYLRIRHARIERSSAL